MIIIYTTIIIYIQRLLYTQLNYTVEKKIIKKSIGHIY